MARCKRQIIVESESESSESSESENEREKEPKVSDVKRKKIGSPENCSEEKPHQFEMNPIVSSGNQLSWKFEKVKEMTDEGMYSDKFTLQNIDWKIYVCTRTVASKKSLAVFLHCDSGNEAKKNWICKTNSVYKILNQNENGKDSARKIYGCHDSKRIDWGCPSFLEWSTLESDGYMKKNSIIVEIELDFKYYDFSKNIPNYTDIIFNVEDTKFYVNKGLLCSKSEYFYNKFVVDNSDAEELTIENVKAEDFLYFIASFCLFFEKVEKKNYKQLIKLAAQYQTPILHRNCEKYLISNKSLSVEKKIGYADKHGYVELMQACIDSLKTTAQIKMIQKSIEFKKFKDTTKLAIMSHLFNLV